MNLSLCLVVLWAMVVIPTAAQDATSKSGSVLQSAPSTPKHPATPLECILTGSKTDPDLDCIVKLTPGDRPALIRAWKRQRELCDKQSLAFALAWVPDAAASELLIDTVRQGIGDLRFGPTNMQCMQWITAALGIAARSSDNAYEFALKSTDWHFVMMQKKWNYRGANGEEEESIAATLAALCIQALGCSGRAEAKGAFEGIRKARAILQSDGRPLAKRYVDGALITAMSRHFASTVDGPEGALRAVCNGSVYDQYKSRWLATKEGQEWQAWYENFNRQRGVKLVDPRKE